jgi:hypothetical protein
VNIPSVFEFSEGKNVTKSNENEFQLVDNENKQHQHESPTAKVNDDILINNENNKYDNDQHINSNEIKTDYYFINNQPNPSNYGDFFNKDNNNNDNNNDNNFVMVDNYDLEEIDEEAKLIQLRRVENEERMKKLRLKYEEEIKLKASIRQKASDYLERFNMY